VLVERLRQTERRDEELTAALEARQTRQAPAWAEIERRVRRSLADWRSLMTRDVAEARQRFRRLLRTPIMFTPFADGGRHGCASRGDRDGTAGEQFFGALQRVGAVFFAGDSKVAEKVA
jgi:hypothetical protein